MNARTQLVCAWSGIVFMVLFFLGFWVFAGFIPPPAPKNDPQEVAKMFRDNKDGIRFGLFLTMGCSALLALWFAVIGVQMRRIEGKHSPLAFAQMIAGACTVLEFIFPLMVWQTAAYRAERSPEIIQTLNDLAWLPFLGIVSTAIVQGVVIGVAILRDKRERPVFPRWAGYFNIWVIFLLAPGGLIVFFQDGPLAWNGILAWWLVLVAFFLWISVFSWVLIKAVRQQAHDEADEPDLAAEVAQLRRELERLSAA